MRYPGIPRNQALYDIKRSDTKSSLLSYPEYIAVSSDYLLHNENDQTLSPWAFYVTDFGFKGDEYIK